MNKHLLLVAVAFCAHATIFAQSTNNVTVFATGLNNPRGLTFGPDRSLYVAEAGTGGTNSTEGCCEQTGPEVGPYTGSRTGARISRIDSDGVRTTFVDDLPSTQSNAATGHSISGVADVAFIGHTLYALLSGAGCSHGVPQVPALPNSVVRINADGSAEIVANLSAFLMAYPVAHPDADDFEPDGTWYSMVASRGNLYAVEPNHGELDVITPNGDMARIADISATFGHIVPTALATRGDGKFYVGNLGTFPINGSSKILQISKDGKIKIVADGLYTILGLTFDSKHRLYALESMTHPGFPGPDQFGSGKVVRIDNINDKNKAATPTVIASGLTFPTGMTLGPDGALYVSNFGIRPGNGEGQIVRIAVPQK